MAVTKKGRFPLEEAYSFAKEHGLADEVERIREMPTKFKSYNSTVRRGYVINLFERNGLLCDFFDQVWPRGRTLAGAKEIERCRSVKRDFEASGAHR
jgi:hypothetical protein